jgi:hypothetical protein
MSLAMQNMIYENRRKHMKDRMNEYELPTRVGQTVNDDNLSKFTTNPRHFQIPTRDQQIERLARGLMFDEYDEYEYPEWELCHEITRNNHLERAKKMLDYMESLDEE